MVEEAAGLALFKGRREIRRRKLQPGEEPRTGRRRSERNRTSTEFRPSRQAKKAEAFRLVRSELVELEKLGAARRLLDQESELKEQSWSRNFASGLNVSAPK